MRRGSGATTPLLWSTATPRARLTTMRQVGGRLRGPRSSVRSPPSTSLRAAASLAAHLTRRTRARTAGEFKQLDEHEKLRAAKEEAARRRRLEEQHRTQQLQAQLAAPSLQPPLAELTWLHYEAEHLGYSMCSMQYRHMRTPAAPQRGAMVAALSGVELTCPRSRGRPSRVH